MLGLTGFSLVSLIFCVVLCEANERDPDDYVVQLQNNLISKPQSKLFENSNEVEEVEIVPHDYKCYLRESPKNLVAKEVSNFMSRLVAPPKKPTSEKDDSKIKVGRQEDLVDSHKSLYSVVQVDTWNASHVALTLKSIRSCNLGQQDHIKFQKYEGYIGNGLNKSEFEVELHLDDHPTLREHDASKLIMLYDKTGWTRVLYDNSLLRGIQNQLEVNSRIFPKGVKFLMLDNYFDIAKTEMVNYTTALGLTRYIDRETDAFVWTYLTLVFTEIDQKFSSHPNHNLFLKYVAKKTETMLDLLGAQEKHPFLPKEVLLNRHVLRKQLLLWNCKNETGFCYNYAKSLLTKIKSDPVDIPYTDINGDILCKLVQVGGTDMFELAFEIFQNYSDSRLVHELGCSSDASVISRLFYKLLEANSTKQETDMDFSYILTQIAVNSAARPQFLEFLGANFDYIIKTNGTAEIAALLRTYAKYLSTKENFKEVEFFIRDHWNDLAEERSIIEKAVRNIEKNIVWMETHAEDISRWLKYQ